MLKAATGKKDGWKENHTRIASKMKRTGSGSGWWMTANDQTPRETEEPVGGFEFNSAEGCCSKGPGRSKEQRVRRWQRPREETVSVRTREEGARV